MDNFYTVFFTSLEVEYHCGLPTPDMREKILAKAQLKKTTWRGPRYSVVADKPLDVFTIIRRGSMVSVVVEIKKEPDSPKCVLKIRPLINPLFIVIPIILFMSPALFISLAGNNLVPMVIFLVTVLSTWLLSALFAYLPMEAERKLLEKELNLTS